MANDILKKFITKLDKKSGDVVVTGKRMTNSYMRSLVTVMGKEYPAEDILSTILDLDEKIQNGEVDLNVIKH